MYEACISRRRPLGNRMTNPYRKAAKNSPPELDENVQGECILIVLLVAFVFWVAIKNTGVGTTLSNGWSSVTSCLNNPATRTASSQ